MEDQQISGLNLPGLVKRVVMQYGDPIDVHYLPIRKYKLQPIETWCSTGVV